MRRTTPTGTRTGEQKSQPHQHQHQASAGWRPHAGTTPIGYQACTSRTRCSLCPLPVLPVPVHGSPGARCRRAVPWLWLHRSGWEETRCVKGDTGMHFSLITGTAMFYAFSYVVEGHCRCRTHSKLARSPGSVVVRCAATCKYLTRLPRPPAAAAVAGHCGLRQRHPGHGPHSHAHRWARQPYEFAVHEPTTLPIR